MTIIRECNNCGLFCHITPCVVGLSHANGAVEDKPCPALTRKGDIYLCGFMLEPEKHLDLSWASSLDDDDYRRVLAVSIENIQSKLKGAFKNECDSILGQGTQDHRIPIHMLPDDYAPPA